LKDFQVGSRRFKGDFNPFDDITFQILILF
jgi:hypothetical protein